MTDIPEDVMKLAREIVREFSAVSMYEDEHEEAIARALIADRAAQAERRARLEEEATDAEIEAAARSMYGKNWSHPTEAPGHKMKDVWRKYARDAVAGFLAARALSQEGS